MRNPHRPRGRDRRASARPVGLAIAAALALAFLGIIVWFTAVSGPRRVPAAQAAAERDPVAAPDIRSINADEAQGEARLTRSGGTVAQWADERDPSRLAGEITYRALDPLEGKRYLMHEPRVWLFLRDGRRVHIRAQSAKVYWPDTQNARPESAQLSGSVTLRLFEAGPPDAPRPDPETDTPDLTFRAPSLAFDSTLGEISTPDAIEARTAQITYSGTGMRVLFNEADQRIELLRVERDQRLTVRSLPSPARDEEPEAPAAPAPTADPVAQASPAPEPTQTLYRAEFSGGVSVSAADATLESDRLELWARLFDNQLRPGAIAQLTPRRPAPAPAGTTEPAPGTTAASGPAPAGDPALPAEPEPSTLVCPGALELRPIDRWPDELARDDLAGRFTDEQAVRFGRENGPSGSAPSLEYRATTADLLATSPDERPVELRTPAGDEITVSRLTLNLATGVGQARGAGELRGTASREAGEPGGSGSVTWNEQADFLFDTAAADRPLQQIREVTLTGGVRLRERPEGEPGLTLDAGLLRVTFEPGAQPSDPPSLRRLAASESVRARDADGGTLDSDRLDVAFAPSAPGEPLTPVSGSARGSVRAEREGATLTAGTLDFTFARADGSGSPELDRVNASDNVRFTGSAGETALADRLTAEAGAQRVELFGAPAVASQNGARVESVTILFDALQRRAQTPGPGRFVQEGDEALGRAGVEAAWNGSMSFDDPAGILLCSGGAWARSRPDALTIDTAAAHDIRITLDPLSEGEAPEAQPRRVRTIELRGGEGRRASVESRRYSAPPGPVQADSEPPREGLERLVYLESATIDADALAGVFRAPAAGRLIASDRRPLASPAPSSGPLSPTPDLGRGDSLFDWDGSLVFERGAGLITMTQRVRLTHRPPAGELVDLEADQVRALVREENLPASTPAAGLPADFSGQLVRADASGAVWLRTGQREMTAGSLSYDAGAASAVALAAPGGVVTAIDAGTNVPLQAPAMRWDLNAGRIEIIEPGTIVMPR